MTHRAGWYEPLTWVLVRSPLRRCSGIWSWGRDMAGTRGGASADGARPDGPTGNGRCVLAVQASRIVRIEVAVGVDTASIGVMVVDGQPAFRRAARAVISATAGTRGDLGLARDGDRPSAVATPERSASPISTAPSSMRCSPGQPSHPWSGEARPRLALVRPPRHPWTWRSSTLDRLAGTGAAVARKWW
jgi:hypothetical protein